MRKVYKKLVRDKIPEIIKAANAEPKTRILDDEEYLKELIKKIKEEADELMADPGAEELADVEEIVLAIRDALHLSAEDLEKVRIAKANKRGGFKKKIFLESVKE